MQKNRGSKGLTYAFLTVAAMVAALPVVGVLFIALDRPGAIVSGLTVPTHLSLENLERVWTQGNFDTALPWSALITVVTVALATALAVPAGYAFATLRFPGRSPLFYLFVFG